MESWGKQQNNGILEGGKQPLAQPALKDDALCASSPPKAFCSPWVPAGTVQLLTAVNRWGERGFCLILLPGMNGNYP